MKIAVSFDKDADSRFYGALKDHFCTVDTAVYGNNLTNFFPRGPIDFNNYERLNDAVRCPDLIVILYSKHYKANDWLRSELDAFLGLGVFRVDDRLILLIPTGDIELGDIPKYYHDWIEPELSFREGGKEELSRFSAYLGKRRKELRARSRGRPRSNRVFVVHGHDVGATTELEIFLSRIGMTPIVLHRQPNEGLTIIEKFEKYSDVDFAIVLVSPDDVAGPSRNQSSGGPTELRARQNVIFELGFFVGKLDRKRVCCVCRRGVTLPSDIHGLVYKEYLESIEEIKWSLIQELRAAGYNVK